MKVLFIGGTGNISSASSRLCVARGIDLYLLNRGQRPVNLPGAKVLQGDIDDIVNVEKLLLSHHWDVVVNWIAFTTADIERDLHLFRGRTRQYVFISSASCYQKPATHAVITESTPLCNPRWQYSRDKIACEVRLERALREEGFPITIVRPSLTYETVIPVVFAAWTEFTIVERMRKGKKIIVHGDGTSLWTVTHARDFAKGLVGLLGHQQAIGHAFHITSDEILTWDQIYQALADAAGVQANIVHIASDFIVKHWPEKEGTLLGDKAVSVIFDNSKIKRFIPGFQATIPFSNGIRETLQWFEADAERRVINADSDQRMDALIERYECL